MKPVQVKGKATTVIRRNTAEQPTAVRTYYLQNIQFLNVILQKIF